jgi:putative membrane protein
MKNITRFTVATVFSLASLSAFAQAAPNDAQIAAIVVTANTVDIDAGKLAKKMSKNKEVKKFAKQMVADHTGVNKKAIALVKKLKVTPEDSDTSKSLKDGGDANISKLKGLKGKEFDKAYVDNEVTYHQAVIDALDKTLIPNAKNAELKDTLVNVRPAFVAHLEHAKHIQASMK